MFPVLFSLIRFWSVSSYRCGAEGQPPRGRYGISNFLYFSFQVWLGTSKVCESFFEVFNLSQVWLGTKPVQGRLVGCLARHWAVRFVHCSLYRCVHCTLYCRLYTVHCTRLTWEDLKISRIFRIPGNVQEILRNYKKIQETRKKSP